MNWHDWTATATVIGAYLLIVLAFIAAFEVTEWLRHRREKPQQHFNPADWLENLGGPSAIVQRVRDPWPWADDVIGMDE